MKGRTTFCPHLFNLGILSHSASLFYSFTLSKKELIEVDQPFHSFLGMLVSFLHRNADSLGNLIL